MKSKSRDSKRLASVSRYILLLPFKLSTSRDSFIFQDCVLLTVNPTDPSKSPFSELREVIPVRLSTDPWTANGSGLGARRESLLQPPTPPTPNDFSNF